MIEVARTKLVLTGFDGAPGLNVFNWCAPAHVAITQTHVDDFHETLYDSLDALNAAVFAAGVTWTIDPDVSVFEDETGTLIGAFTCGTGPWTQTGTGAGGENRATQVGIQWGTGVFRHGRHVKGRTFLGPASSLTIDTNGDVNSTIRSTWPGLLSGIYDPLVSRLVVWSRPSVAHPVGGIADVSQCTISTKPFVLRGRR